MGEEEEEDRQKNRRFRRRFKEFRVIMTKYVFSHKKQTVKPAGRRTPFYS